MTKVVYFLLCENLIRDDQDRISIINVFDNINSSSEKAVPNKFVIAIGIQPPREDLPDGKLVLRIDILNEKGKVILSEKSDEKNIPEEALTRGTTIVSPLELGGRIVFTESGPHAAKLYVNDREYAEARFKVSLGQKEKK